MEPNQGVLNSTFLKKENYGPATDLILWYDQAQMAFTALFYTLKPSLKKKVPSIELKFYHHRMV